jgi:hypothetical protein
MSEHIERWKELAALCLREQDPAKLAELASEMNRVMATNTTNTPLDPRSEQLEALSVGRKGATCSGQF